MYAVWKGFRYIHWDYQNQMHWEERNTDATKSISVEIQKSKAVYTKTNFDGWRYR